MAASFSADIVMEKNGKTETGKFYLLDQYYRLEILEDGKPMAIIADREKKIHRVLNMEGKVFFKISSDDFVVRFADPFKASEYMVSEYGSKVEGNEKINGINCEKQVIIVEDKKIHSRWFSNELNFPVKLVTYNGKKVAYLTELKNIREVDLQKELFAPPSDFKQVEEPGAAEKRKSERQRKQEEALPGLTDVKTARVPCYVKIASGGELRVPIDTDGKAYLIIINEAKGESVYTILKWQNGKPKEGYEAKPWMLERKGHRQNWDFNDKFNQTEAVFLVDEIRIKVDKGLVYARMTQIGTDRNDGYSSWGQTDFDVDPKRPFTLRITGDNPFGDHTTGRFVLRYEAGGGSEAIPFTVETGKTLTWDYTADKGVKTVAVTISEGDGRAKISLVQPPVPKQAVIQKPPVKTAPKQKYIPKPKVVDQFTVTHPYGTGKPLTPGKDLTITVTGVSGAASGTIDLHSDEKKTKKIDAFKFSLKKNQAESFAVSGEKNVGWATVWVHKGSFKVKLDQSIPIKLAVPTPKTDEKPIVEVVQSKPASSGKILNNGLPLMEGSRVVKEKAHGASSQVDLEVSASPEEVVNFYKQAMTAKGWQPGITMVQGSVGILQLKKGISQITLKATGKGEKSIVKIAVISQ